MNKISYLKSRAGSLLLATLLTFSTGISHGFDLDINFPNFNLQLINPDTSLTLDFSTIYYPIPNPVVLYPSTGISLVLPPLDLGSFEVTSGYDPGDLNIGENAQLGFLLLDGTLAFSVKPTDARAGRRASLRAGVRVGFDPATLRARARGRAGAREGRVANARLMRYDEEGAQWVRAVRAIRSPEGRAGKRFMPRTPYNEGRTLGQYGNYVNPDGSAYVWAVLDTNSQYTVGVNQVLDTDGDGLFDEEDNCPSTANADQQDSDTDGIGDVCDSDMDNDGITNALDNCPVISNVGQEDTDGDLVGDACDADDDGDSVLDVDDNCSLIANTGQEDADLDGKGDVCDDDLDGDGAANAADNCPLLANGDQSDFDYDGTGDTCDADIDGDSVVNAEDLCEFSASGAAVNTSDGYSIDQSCPCEGPRGSTEAWRNHGKYVSCVAKTSNTFMKMGLIMDFEKGDIVSVAAASACGVK